jgi:hypothetical protein
MVNAKFAIEYTVGIQTFLSDIKSGTTNGTRFNVGVNQREHAHHFQSRQQSRHKREVRK